MGKATAFSPEVRERAVRLVFEQLPEHGSQWATICSVSSKIGCTAETLRKWVRQTERDSGKREGLTTANASGLCGFSSLRRRIESSSEQTRSFVWLRHILPRRSSTAQSSG
jgi:transposase-like protein